MPGVIAAIQTFGGRINFHPHLHFLVTEGGVDKAGMFHKILRIDDSRRQTASSPGDTRGSTCTAASGPGQSPRPSGWENT